MCRAAFAREVGFNSRRVYLLTGFRPDGSSRRPNLQQSLKSRIAY